MAYQSSSQVASGEALCTVVQPAQVVTHTLQDAGIFRIMPTCRYCYTVTRLSYQKAMRQRFLKPFLQPINGGLPGAMAFIVSIITTAQRMKSWGCFKGKRGCNLGVSRGLFSRYRAAMLWLFLLAWRTRTWGRVGTSG
jgi:hypothetical protein